MKSIVEDIKKSLMGAGKSAPASGGAAGSLSSSSSELIKSLIGDIAEPESFYFPSDLIGGTCPRVVGAEESIVWNAAAEACDSERVHVVWRSFGSKIWYLAVKSADLSSHSNSWCPFAALLPSEENAEDIPVCYTYFGEEMAVLMVVDKDDMHIFRGSAAIVRAKAERTARELGEKAKVVNIDLFRIEQMTPVPWYSVSLFEDRARRVLATVSVLVSIGITLLSFLVWFYASMSMISSKRDLAEALQQTQAKSVKLMNEAQGLRASPLRVQIENFLVVNDGLLALNGFLSIYEIKDNKVKWNAVVPPSATADRISAIGGRNIETNEQGVVIGNADVREFDNKNRRK